MCVWAWVKQKRDWGTDIRVDGAATAACSARVQGRRGGRCVPAEASNRPVPAGLPRKQALLKPTNTRRTPATGAPPSWPMSASQRLQRHPPHPERETRRTSAARASQLGLQLHCMSQQHTHPARQTRRTSACAGCSPLRPPSPCRSAAWPGRSRLWGGVAIGTHSLAAAATHRPITHCRRAGLGCCSTMLCLPAASAGLQQQLSLSGWRSTASGWCVQQKQENHRQQPATHLASGSCSDRTRGRRTAGKGTTQQ